MFWIESELSIDWMSGISVKSAQNIFPWPKGQGGTISVLVAQSVSVFWFNENDSNYPISEIIRLKLKAGIRNSGENEHYVHLNPGERQNITNQHDMSL